MKKIVNAIGMIVLVISTLLFTTTLFVDGASQHATTTLVNMEIENRVNAIVDEIQAIIPVQNDEAVATLITKIQEDERISKLVNTYARQFVHDLASDEAHQIDMNDEVHGLLLGFSKEFEDVLGDVINPIYKEAIIREVIIRVDFNAYYGQAVSKFKTSMSPSQLKLVSVTNTILENTGLYRGIAIGLTLVILILLVLNNRKSMFGLKQIGVSLILSGLIHLAIRMLTPMLIDGKISQLKGVLDFSVYLSFGLGFVIIGFAFRLIGGKTSE